MASDERADQSKQQQEKERIEKEKGHGQMTVSEAGHLGGMVGGPRVRELINEGKQEEAEGGNK